MTHNQIEYAKLQETKRANQAKETEDIRYHDMANELGYANLAEAARGNTLNYQSSMAATAQRAQAAAWSHDENVQKLGIQESETTSTINYRSAQVAESKRHNVESERLTKRGQNVQAGTSMLSTGAQVLGNVLKFIPMLGAM